MSPYTSYDSADSQNSIFPIRNTHARRPVSKKIGVGVTVFNTALSREQIQKWSGCRNESPIEKELIVTVEMKLLERTLPCWMGMVLLLLLHWHCPP